MIMLTIFISKRQKAKTICLHHNSSRNLRAFDGLSKCRTVINGRNLSHFIIAILLCPCGNFVSALVVLTQRAFYGSLHNKEVHIPRFTNCTFRQGLPCSKAIESILKSSNNTLKINSQTCCFLRVSTQSLSGGYCPLLRSN